MKSMSSLVLKAIALAAILCGAAGTPVSAKAKGTATAATDGTTTDAPAPASATTESKKSAKADKGNTDTAKLKEGDVGYTVGTISNVNAAAGTLQIDSRVFTVATNCVIGSGKKAGTLADFKKGDKIEMRYVFLNGVLSVTSLTSKSADTAGKKKKSDADDADSAGKKKKSKE